MLNNANNLIVGDKQGMLLKSIGRTGFYVNNSNPNFNVSNHTLYSCINKGLIIRDSNYLIFTKVLKTYSLTDLGKEYVKTKYLIHPYKSKTNQIEHDYILNKVYLSLLDSERDSWITETELGIRYANVSVIDGMYINNNNEKVGVEIITNNYTPENIMAKTQFLERFCDKQIVINTGKL